MDICTAQHERLYLRNETLACKMFAPRDSDTVLEASPSLKTLPFPFGVKNTLSLVAKACMSRRQHVLSEIVALGVHAYVLAGPAGHRIPPFAHHRLSD